LHNMSPCVFTGGLAALSLALHLLEYPDVLTY
jgi:hypothetical protein